MLKTTIAAILAVSACAASAAGLAIPAADPAIIVEPASAVELRDGKHYAPAGATLRVCALDGCNLAAAAAPNREVDLDAFAETVRAGADPLTAWPAFAAGRGGAAMEVRDGKVHIVRAPAGAAPAAPVRREGCPK